MEGLLAVKVHVKVKVKVKIKVKIGHRLPVYAIRSYGKDAGCRVQG